MAKMIEETHLFTLLDRLWLRLEEYLCMALHCNNIMLVMQLHHAGTGLFLMTGIVVRIDEVLCVFVVVPAEPSLHGAQ